MFGILRGIYIPDQIQRPVEPPVGQYADAIETRDATTRRVGDRMTFARMGSRLGECRPEGTTWWIDFLVCPGSVSLPLGKGENIVQVVDGCGRGDTIAAGIGGYFIQSPRPNESQSSRLTDGLTCAVRQTGSAKSAPVETWPI